MRRLLIVVVSVLTMALLVPVGTVVAWAGDEQTSRVVLTDARGDVLTDKSESGGPVLAGKKPTVDVIRAMAAHRHRVVTSMTRVIDLRRVGRLQLFSAQIETATDRFALLVRSSKRNWAGWHVLESFNTGRVRCPGLAHDIDYETNRVTVAVPRRCIAAPNWVRLSLGNGLAGKDGHAYVDNPHNDRPNPPRRGTIRLYQP